MKKFVNYLKKLTIFFIMTFLSCSQEEEIVSENDCLPEWGMSGLPLCRGQFNQAFHVYTDAYGYGQCGNWLYDGDYNLYLRKNGTDIAFLGGPYYMNTGTLDGWFTFSVPYNYETGLYSAQLRRVTDSHTINFSNIYVNNCTVISSPAPSSSLTEFNPTTVIWNTNYFTNNVSITLKKASDNSTIANLTSSTANDGSFMTSPIFGVSQNTSCYISITDGTYSYSSGNFTVLNVDLVIRPNGHTETEESESYVLWDVNEIPNCTSVRIDVYYLRQSLYLEGFRMLALSTPNDGEFVHEDYPASMSGDGFIYKVKITPLDGGYAAQYSQNYFQVF